MRVLCEMTRMRENILFEYKSLKIKEMMRNVKKIVLIQ